MLITAALSTFFLLGSGVSANASGALNLPPLQLMGQPVRSIARANPPSWEGARAPGAASSLLTIDQRAAQEAGETPASTGAATEGGGEAGGAAAGGGAAAEEEPSIDLIRQRERFVRMHRPLGFAAWASLLVTEVAGTILAANQHTLFGPGSCNVPNPGGGNPCILGDFGGGRGPLNAFHELSAFITVGFYAAAGMYALAMPDPEHAAAGDDDRGHRLRIHKALAYVHLAGMILLPILGVLSVEPGLVGLNLDTSSPMAIAASRRNIDNYQAAMRTIHLGVGYVTFAALTVAMLYQIAF